VARVNDPPAYPIASVDNVLRLLGMLKGREGITLSEASKQLGVARSTAHRLLAMLRFHDFVRQEPDTKRYVPGPALLEIAVSMTGGWDVRALARPELEAVVHQLEETVHLVTLDGSDAFFLDSVECQQIVRVTSRAGISMPARVTASGKVLLANLDEEELRSLLGASWPKLRETLRVVREQGYATNFEESERDLGAVAVPIPAVDSMPSLALSLSAPIGRIDEARAAALAAPLATSARRIAKRLERGAGSKKPAR